MFARLALTAALLGLAAAPAPTWAGKETVRENSSLNFVPADAAFYMAMAHNREQVERFLASNAMKRLATMMVEAAIDEAFKQGFEKGFREGAGDAVDEDSLKQMKDWWDAPENRDLQATLLDTVSNEIFIYGGADYVEWAKLNKDINRAAQDEMLRAMREGKLDFANPYASLDWTKVLPRERLLAVNVPDTVIGFKLADPERAKTQLTRLKDMIEQSLEVFPDFKERFGVEQIGPHEFLSLKLSGEQIPWAEVTEGLDEALGALPAEQQELIKELIGSLREKTLTLSLGVRRDYLLFSIGDNNDHLRNLNRGKLLLDRPEFAQLRKLGEKKITGVGYISPEFVKNSRDLHDALDEMAMLVPLLGHEAGLDEATQTRIGADIVELAADLKKMLPKAGGAMAFTMMTDAGYEGYAYDWSENLYLDADQPLNILEHVGGEPLAYLAAREQYKPENYKTVKRWFVKGLAYFEEFALPTMSEEEQAQYQTVRTETAPLLERFNRACEEMAMPALRDGQSALVLDAKLASKQWCEHMPAADKPLPLLEMAVVQGVSDADLLKSALVEFHDLSNEVLAKLHAAKPDEFPELQIPRPEVDSTENAEFFSHKLPAEARVDGQLAPTLGLSKNVAAWTLSRGHAERLLEAKPLASTCLASRHAGPMAAACHLNFAGLIEAAKPWLDYGATHASKSKAILPIGPDVIPVFRDPDTAPDESGSSGENSVGELDPEVIKQNMAKVHKLLEILQCFKGYSSVTYAEEGALVTHSEWRFEDLKSAD